MVRPVIRPAVRSVVYPVSGNSGGISWRSYWTTRKPSNCIVTVTGQTTATVTWSDAASAADGLKVYVSTDGGATKTLKATVAFGVETASITGLTADTYYDFYVVAYKGTNESDAITDFDITTIVLSSVANQIFWYDSVNVTNEAGSADIATDLSGTTGNLQAPAEANRPLIVADSLNGYPALSFDGSSNRLVKTDAAERALPYTVFAVAKIEEANADSAVIGGTNSTYSAPIYMRISSGNKLGIFAGTLFTTLMQALGTAQIMKSIVNGAASNIRAGNNEVTGNAGTNTLKGLEWGGYANANGQCAKFLGYEAVGYSGELSKINQIKISRSLGIKYAIDERETFDRVFHNSFEYDSTNRKRSAQSEFRFMYTGTTLQIKANPSIAGINKAFADLGIFVNGVYDQVITYTGGSDTGFKEITLPAGYKEIRIVEAVTSMPMPAAILYGTWITDILANASFKKLPVINVPEKIVFLGDSITVGSNCAYPCKESFPRLFYVENNKEVTVLGWGYNQLKQMASDVDKLATTVSYMTSVFSNVTTTKKLVIMLGVNDYNAGTETATFGGWYADLLNAINVSDSDIHIYCISPIRKGGDPALLADYRAQIQTVCAARPTYTTYINGYSLCDLTDLDDGTHPTTAGHRKIYDGIKSFINN